MFVVAALYHFTPFEDLSALKAPLAEVACSHGVRGTLLLATEGINGTIAGSREGIDAVLQDRVDAVRENAAAYADALGLDEDFIRQLWVQLIDNSCQREDQFIHDD